MLKSELSNDVNILELEIKYFQNEIKRCEFEIGKRLEYIKVNDLVHGEWEKWLEKMNIEKTFAKRCMKIARECYNRPLLQKIEYTKAIEILRLDEFGFFKDEELITLSVRQLKELRKKYQTPKSREYRKKQDKFIDELKDFLPEEIEIKIEYHVLNGKYRLDGYFPKFKIAVEYDEKEHEGKLVEDIKKQCEIEKELGCVFIRVYEGKEIEGIKEIMKTIIKSMG